MEDATETDESQKQISKIARRQKCSCPNCLDGVNKVKKKKLHNCHVCNQLYGKSSHLKAHIRSHTGECPYECQLCGRKFSRSDMHQRHLRIHSGERKYTCSLCSKSFMRKDHLDKHIKVHRDKPKKKINFVITTNNIHKIEQNRKVKTDPVSDDDDRKGNQEIKLENVKHELSEESDMDDTYTALSIVKTEIIDVD